MLHLHHEVWTDAVDVDELLAALPALIQALQDLDIDRHGAQPPSGGPRRAGLRLVGGTHALPGARYQHTSTSTFEVNGQEHRRTTVTDVEVLADEPERATVRIRTRGSKAVTTAEPRTA